MAPAAVIVGTGRSGSGYIARVLTEAGVACGHEAWWNPTADHTPGLAVDSSWCALALGLDDYPGRVFHQIRHPLDVVSSLAKNPPDGSYRDLLCRLLPWVPIDPVEFGMLTWHTYVEAAEKRAEWSWRLDDVDAELVRKLGSAVGVGVTTRAAVAALRSVRSDHNWHGAGPRYGWVDLPAGGLRDALMAWAHRWGWT